jgi:hypothetical protein
MSRNINTKVPGTFIVNVAPMCKLPKVLKPGTHQDYNDVMERAAKTEERPLREAISGFASQGGVR